MKVLRIDKGQILLNPITKTPYAKNYYSGNCPCDDSGTEKCYPCAICTFLDVACTKVLNVCRLSLNGDYDLPLVSTYSDYSRWYDPSDINPDYIDDGSENDNSDWKNKYNTYWTREQILAGECTVSLDALEPEREIDRAQCVYKYKDDTVYLIVMLEVVTRNLKGLTVVNNSPAFFNWSLLTVEVNKWNGEKQKYVFEKSYFVRQNAWTDKAYALGNATKIAGRNMPFQLNNFEFDKHVSGKKISLTKDLTLETFDQDYVVMSIPKDDIYGSFRRYWNCKIKNSDEGCDDDWNNSVSVKFEYDETVKGNCWFGYSECDVNIYRETEHAKPPVQPDDPTNPDSPNNQENNPPHGNENDPDSPANPENPDNPNNPNNPIPPDSPVNPNNPDYDPSLDPTTPPAPPPPLGTLKYCVAAFAAIAGTDGNWIVNLTGTSCLLYEEIDWVNPDKWVPSDGVGGCNASYTYIRIGSSGCDENTCDVDTSNPSVAGLPLCKFCFFGWEAFCVDDPANPGQQIWAVSRMSSFPYCREETFITSGLDSWSGDTASGMTYYSKGSNCADEGGCSWPADPAPPSEPSCTPTYDCVYQWIASCWDGVVMVDPYPYTFPCGDGCTLIHNQWYAEGDYRVYNMTYGTCNNPDPYGDNPCWYNMPANPPPTPEPWC